MRDGTGYAFHSDTSTITARCEGCGTRQKAEALQAFTVSQLARTPSVQHVCRTIRRLELIGVAAHTKILACTCACAAQCLIRLYDQAQRMLRDATAYPSGFAMIGSEAVESDEGILIHA